MIKRTLTLLSLFALIIACDKTGRVDTQEVKEEIRNREIRKISDAEIFDKGWELGTKESKKLIDCLNGLKKENYKQCLDQVDSSLIKQVRLIEDDNHNLDKKSKDLIEAYFYNYKEGQKLYPNIQDLNNGQLLFTSPYYKNGDSLSVSLPDSISDFGILCIYYSKKNVVLRLNKKSSND